MYFDRRIINTCTQIINAFGAPICNIIFELYGSVLNISYSYSLKIVCHLQNTQIAAEVYAI